MINKINKMIDDAIKYVARRHLINAEHAGYCRRFLEDQKNRDSILQYVVEDAQGKKIIYCSNEWTDPLFGTVVGSQLVTQSQQPMLVVECALTGQAFLIHPNSYYHADKKMVECILKLNPFERWNMSSTQCHRSNIWEKSYPNGVITPSCKLLEMLKQVGFI